MTFSHVLEAPYGSTDLMLRCVVLQICRANCACQLLSQLCSIKAGSETSARVDRMYQEFRMCVAIHVNDLAASTVFYSRVLGLPPSRATSGRVDWRLEQPPIDFSILGSQDDRDCAHQFGFDVPAPHLPSVLQRIGSSSGDIRDPDGNQLKFFSSDLRGLPVSRGRSTAH